MSEKLFLPKTQHEKIAAMFKRFTKAIETDLKQKEKALATALAKADSVSQKQMEVMDLEPINELDTPLKEESHHSGLYKTSSVNVLPATKGLKPEAVRRGKKARHSSIMVGASGDIDKWIRKMHEDLKEKNVSLRVNRVLTKVEKVSS